MSKRGIPMRNSPLRIPPTKRIDWKVERDRIDLATVATSLLGQAPGRRGEGGRKLWWSCPFHDDANPSFCVEPGKPWWRCYGCDEKGDAASLVMKLTSCSFPEAIAHLTGGPAPRSQPGRLAKAPSKASARPDPVVVGMSPEDAARVVAEGEARMWSPERANERSYLTGPHRCLTPETIRAAGLGFVDPVEALTRDGKPYAARGIVIPWFAGGRVALLKVRQPGGYRPKYAEVYRNRSLHSGIYPGPEAIRPGRPLIVVEGEFDALCLGQELGDIAAVVTLGSASARPDPAILGRMLSAAPWFVATDGDEAGEKAAGDWPATARRVRPPGSFKDWTEAKAGGIDLARWWREILAGVERPALFTWEELSRWRWGPAVNDPTPGIIIRGEGSKI
jgi:hypothetical protein